MGVGLRDEALVKRRHELPAHGRDEAVAAASTRTAGRAGETTTSAAATRTPQTVAA
jgi:hypothetical protein